MVKGIRNTSVQRVFFSEKFSRKDSKSKCPVTSFRPLLYSVGRL